MTDPARERFFQPGDVHLIVAGHQAIAAAIDGELRARGPASAWSGG